MAARTQPVGYRWLLSLQTSAVRIGLYTGVGMSGVFVVWLFLANRVPFLERFALARKVAGAAWLVFLALCPVLRLLGHPRRLLCLFFSALPDRIGAFHLVMTGSIAYAIVATLAWVGNLIWAVRGHHEPNSGHHLS